MPLKYASDLLYKGSKINLALQAYDLGLFERVRQAAAAYNVPFQRLSDRHNGITPRTQARSLCQKLTSIDEQTIVRYIISLDPRGFAPRLFEVADIADKLSDIRGGSPVSKSWAARFMSRTKELKMAFNCVKENQRAKQEDSEVISALFKLVQETKDKYGVLDDDIHNFDETAFQMGVIGSMKVVKYSERRTRPDPIQLSDQEWVTVT